MTTIAPPDPSIYEDFQSFEPGTRLDLFELDLSSIIPSAPVLRFTRAPHPNGAMVRRGGEVYLPIPIEVEGFDVEAGGSIPQPLLRVSNVSPILGSLLLETQHLRGASLVRYQVLAKWLDEGDDPQPGWYLRQDRHRVEQLASSNREWLEFRLASPLDVGDEQTPRRQAIPKLCLWTYRTWDPVAVDFVYADPDVACPYNAATYFDIDDASTAQPEDDVCSKKLGGCRARFIGRPKPFAGFRGVGAKR